jgi:DNA-binding NtrC family response regulator
MNRVLVADDDPLTCEFFKEILHDLGVEIVTSLDPTQAIRLATRERFDVVICDINFETSTTGIDVRREVKQNGPGTQVILVSGFGTLETALAAVRQGAFDYVSKPFNVEEVRSTVRRALEKRRLKPPSPPPTESNRAEPVLVGSSAKMLAVYKNIAYVADSKTTVLIQGESGTGKELVARAIHSKGPRASKPFVGVNCGALTETLLESELFGHVKGAFTGAVRDRIGRFQLANKGTLFLDEIGEIPLHSQGKLLRVLQEGEFERIGEDVTRRVNVRIIASTNRDLAREVDAGRFREDLYFRLNVFPIESVPLRDRVEDIPLLARHFLERSCRRLGVPRPVLEPRHLEQLKRYTWPGNVRELENIIERAVIYARGGPLRFDIPPSRPLPVRTIESALALEANAPRPAGAELVRYDQLKLLERESIEEALRRSGGKVYGPGGAAELLGIKASTLASRMKVLGIAKSR